MVSAFSESGFRSAIRELVTKTAQIYLADSIPWVVGYSGGKDSTAALQIVWLALESLSPQERTKPVHVISTDTMVENPIVSAWVGNSLKAIRAAACESGLPIAAHQLRPSVQDTFWVNLIGKGYPAPRPKFRWCTERLKIKPSNQFIMDVVKENGEAILVLGTRKAESSARASVMTGLETQRTRESLSPNASLPNSLVYSPLESWTNDDVWTFLMQVKNKWGVDHKNLLGMYQGASEDGECPLVIDTSTPSCGDSRFGCWVCTLVDKDRSMTAMIQNDAEKEWMLPLLELRNELDVGDDRHLRDFRRMSGQVQMFRDRPIPGPYTQSARAHWLKRVLEAQSWVRENGPPEVRDISLISQEELEEIRRIWVIEKHESEDLLPTIYTDTTGTSFAGLVLDETSVWREDLKLLNRICEEDPLQYEMLRNLLDVERRFRTMSRRAGLFEALESTIKRSFYDDVEDAETRARRKSLALAAARDGNYIGKEQSI